MNKSLRFLPVTLLILANNSLCASIKNAVKISANLQESSSTHINKKAISVLQKMQKELTAYQSNLLKHSSVLIKSIQLRLPGMPKSKTLTLLLTKSCCRFILDNTLSPSSASKQTIEILIKIHSDDRAA